MFYFKELAYMVVGVNESEICRVAWHLKIQVRVDVAIFSLKFSRQQVGNSARFLWHSFEAESLPSRNLRLSC